MGPSRRNRVTHVSDYHRKGLPVITQEVLLVKSLYQKFSHRGEGQIGLLELYAKKKTLWMREGPFVTFIPTLIILRSF